MDRSELSDQLLDEIGESPTEPITPRSILYILL